MDAQAERIALHVEVAGAVAPVVVDPAFASPANAVLNGDGSSDRLGEAVSGAGDVNSDAFFASPQGARSSALLLLGLLGLAGQRRRRKTSSRS